jgi:predicted neutral ceramidase superfamily lipid hydrolase
MAKWFSKQISSFAFSLQKTYERLLTSKPSWFVVAAGAVVVALFLLGGGVYDIITHPPVAFFTTSGMVVFYQALTDQTLLESILTMIFYGLGFAGFIVAHRSTKYAYTPRNAYRFLLVGVVLLIIGILLMETGLNTKFGL